MHKRTLQDLITASRIHRCVAMAEKVGEPSPCFNLLRDNESLPPGIGIVRSKTHPNPSGPYGRCTCGMSRCSRDAIFCTVAPCPRNAPVPLRPSVQCGCLLVRLVLALKRLIGEWWYPGSTTRVITQRCQARPPWILKHLISRDMATRNRHRR